MRSSDLGCALVIVAYLVMLTILILSGHLMGGYSFL